MMIEPIKFNTTEERKMYLSKPEIVKALGEDAVVKLIDSNFITAPASTKYHGAYEGGLFDHSVNVAAALQDLTDMLDLQWDTPYSPIRIGILHDICKIDQYRVLRDVITPTYEYDNRPIVKGHGTKSVIYTLQFIPLTQEEIACILYHMGAFTDKSEWKDYTDAVNKYPNVLWTHTADMYASHVLGV